LVTRVSQHCAFLKEGRQGFFNSSLFVQPCRGKRFSCNGLFYIIMGFYLLMMVLREPLISLYS
jgi:hypothetical protein